MLYPLTFQPIFKERVWGGRNLQRLYGKALPPLVPIGESWEISDRPDDVSVIANGPLAGKDLHWLTQNHRQELLGNAQSHGRFPLLIKLLDAEEKLSLQVHPPGHKAAELGGEPKTEMWYIADAKPGAELFVGLKRGVTRQEFERRVVAGTVEHCLHKVSVQPGDVMFLPSGRVHALGAGLVIFEIQQNSDTTYRVFDWNRKGLDGKPRELHVQQSLESIDFDDFEPELMRAQPIGNRSRQTRHHLLRHSLFAVDLWDWEEPESLSFETGKTHIVAVLSGNVRISSSDAQLDLRPGQFCLLPASRHTTEISAGKRTRILRIEPG